MLYLATNEVFTLLVANYSNIFLPKIGKNVWSVY